MKIETGNIVKINDKNTLVLRLDKPQFECELEDCFVLVTKDGRLEKTIATQADLDEIQEDQIVVGVANEL